MNILFYGGHRWNQGPWFRKQQFAQRLLFRGHTVFYVEDSVSMVRKTKSDTTHLFKMKVNAISARLYILQPSAYFPFPQNYYSRYLFNLKLVLNIKMLFARMKISDFVLWYNMVPFSSVSYLFKKNLKIFDLCDDIPSYPLLFNDLKLYELNLSYVRTALMNCDIPIVSATRLKEKYAHLCSKEMIVTPNGHSLSPISFPEKPAPILMSKYKKPWIGFIGTLFKFIDDELLAYLVQSRPDYTFFFIGNVESNFPKEKIGKYSNAVMIDQVPKDSVSDYIRCFDVAINPFKRHEVNDSVNPVKVFEYLAYRKNVVSTKMYSLQKEKIGSFIYFADSYPDFLAKLDLLCNRAPDNPIPEHVINDYHWDSLFKNLIDEITDKYQFRF